MPGRLFFEPIIEPLLAKIRNTGYPLPIRWIEPRALGSGLAATKKRRNLPECDT
jgi:hypothetical protein